MKEICSLQSGQKVRIPLQRGVFYKGYDIGWSEAIYEIKDVQIVSHQ